jgi:haloalkane dehalogenase
MISSDFQFDKRRIAVGGQNMAVVDLGIGDPIVFLHGNPTSSYLWRNVIPHVQHLGRCIAPDLIGMGDSDKLPSSGRDSYTLAEHQRFLDELLSLMRLEGGVVLVLHDWGAALGFDWARRHADQVTGIVYMEAPVRPMTWAEFPESLQSIFQALRSDAGESMVLQHNFFVEQVLPAGVLRQLSDNEMAAYRRPYSNPGEDRRPTLTWPRQVPLDGEPVETARHVQAYADWLCTSQVPKLFLNGEPGAVLTGVNRDFCRRWPNQREVSVAGAHFLQEDSPDVVGASISEWLQGIRLPTQARSPRRLLDARLV